MSHRPYLPLILLLRHIRLGLAGLILAAALGLAAAPLGAQSSGRIAAVVNDEIITVRDLLARLALVAGADDAGLSEEQQRQIAPQVLRGLIDERLQLQEAERLGISVSEADLREGLATIARRNDLEIETFLTELRRRGAPLDALEQQLRAQIAWIKLIGQRLRPQVNVSEAQIEVAQQSAQAVADEPQYLLAEIILPVYDPSEEPLVQEQAERLLAVLREGGDFPALARQVSASATAQRGGDLGWQRGGVLPLDVSDVVATLDVGEYSEPIRTANGYAILWLRDQRQTPEAAAAEVGDPETIRQALTEEQLQRLARRYLRDLRRDAFVEIRL